MDLSQRGEDQEEKIPSNHHGDYLPAFMLSSTTISISLLVGNDPDRLYRYDIRV